MKTTIYFIAALFVVGACSESPIQAEQGTSIYLATGLQKHIKSTYFKGEEKLFELREMAMDRSMDPGAQRRFKTNFDAVQRCDKSYLKTLKSIENLRENLIKSHVKNGSIEQSSRNDGAPAEYDLGELAGKNNLMSHLSASQKQDLIESILELRGIVLKNLVESNSNQERTYSFKDPNLSIEDVKDLNAFNQKLNGTFTEGSISPDDIEVAKKLYTDFTILASDIQENVKEKGPVVDQFSVLSLNLMDLYELRFETLAVFRSRFGGRY